MFLKYLFRLMMFFGIFGFVSSILISTGLVHYPFELPLTSLTTIQEDSVGNIYVGLEAFGYIQKYSSSGEFIKNWRVVSKNENSIFLFEIRTDSIYILPKEKDSFEKVYNLDGMYIRKSQSDLIFEFKKRTNSLISETGITYKLKGRINGKIIKIDMNGVVDIFIKVNFFVNLFFSFSRSWIIIAIGFLGERYVEHKQYMNHDCRHVRKNKNK